MGMATDRQKRFIKALLIDAGYVNPRYWSFYGRAKELPYGPRMRERGIAGGVEQWLERLTKRQASEVIDYLLSQLESTRAKK